MIRKNTAWSACVALFLAISPVGPTTPAAQTPVAPASIGRGTVQGTAIDGSSKPVGGALVQLQSTGASRGVIQTTANESGAFTFNGVTPGSYVLRVRRQGKTVGIGGNVDVKPNQTMRTTVTVAADGPEPGQGFNVKKFAIVSVLVTVALTIGVVAASK
jgi:hypothetical protein